MPNLIGTAPDQVPTNGSLGNMAFQNKEGVVTDLLSTTALTVTGTGVMSVGGTQIFKNTNGNVGIGTGTPARTLEVNGSIRVANANRIEWGGDQYYIAGDTAGAMIFGAAGPERMRLDSSGNVGIGTTAPAARVHIVNSAIGSQLRLQDVTTDATNKYGAISTAHYTNAQSPILAVGVGSLSASNTVFIGGGFSALNAATAIHFCTAANNTTLTGTERMRITGAGNVGIGTGNPASTLNVSTASGDAPVNTSGANAVRLTSTTTAAVGVGPSIFFEGQTGNTTANYGFAAIQGFKSSATLNDYSGSLAFFTQSSGGSTALNERMRIDSAGNVGIGSSAPAGKFEVFCSTAISWFTRVAGDAGTANPAVGLSTGSTTGQIRSFGDLQFITAAVGASPVERARIDSSGRMMVGSTANAFGAKMEIVTSGSSTLLSLFNTTADGGAKILFVDGSNNAAVGNLGGNLLFYANGASSERMRIDTSGNLMVGTTSSSGSASNTTRVIGGVFSTLRSSASVATNTATTIATLPSGEGNYMVSASLVSSGTPSDYNEVAMVCVSITTASITTLVNASQLSLSMSGLNLQVTHLQGLTQTIQYSVLRIL